MDSSSGGPRKDFALDGEDQLWTEDTSSATGFGGQVGNVAFPVKIMADSETQKLERKDFFQRIVEKVDGGFFPNGPFGETK